jgi:hypothetical protein
MTRANATCFSINFQVADQTILCNAVNVDIVAQTCKVVPTFMHHTMAVFMDTDMLSRFMVFQFLDDISKAAVLAVSTEAAGVPDRLQTARTLASSNAVHVRVTTLSARVLLDFPLLRSRTIADLQRRIRTAHRIRCVSQRLVREGSLFPIRGHRKLAELHDRGLLKLTLIRQVPACAHCGLGHYVHYCSRCGTVTYCSQECADSDWHRRSSYCEQEEDEEA